MTLRVIHVGLGGRGSHWLDFIAQRSDVSSVAFVDASREMLDKARARPHPGDGKFFERMEDALAEKKLSAQMLLQVHDELIFEVPDNEVAATLPVVQHVMQDAPFPAVVLSVPLQVDARAANNWDEAH